MEHDDDDGDGEDDDDVDISQYLEGIEGLDEVTPPEYYSSDDTVAAENDEVQQPAEIPPHGEILEVLDYNSREARDNPGHGVRTASRGRRTDPTRSPLRLFGEPATRELRRLASHNNPGLTEEAATGRRRTRTVYRGTEEEEAQS